MVTINHNQNGDAEGNGERIFEAMLPSEHDYHSKVPYYTTILKKRKHYDLPINQGKSIYLITFDQDRKLIDRKLIRSATDGETQVCDFGINGSIGLQILQEHS